MLPTADRVLLLDVFDVDGVGVGWRKTVVSNANEV